MSLSLFKNRELTKACNNLILFRLKHRNHPGHKPKPVAVPVRPSLPDNYTEEANYPPVKPKFPPGHFSPDYDTKLAWKYYDDGQKYTSLKTIQERLSVMAYSNVQQTLDDLKQRRTRHYPIYLTSSLSKTPKMLPFNQYITKSHVSIVDELPSNNHVSQSIDFDLYEKLKFTAKEAILANFSRVSELEDVAQVPSHEESFKPEIIEKQKRLETKNRSSNLLLKDVLSSLTSILSANEANDHLLKAQYGVDVNIKSYWKRCGFEAERPRGAVNPDQDVIRFQFDDIASFQIKCDKPLKPIYNLNDSACSEPKIPDYIYNPSVFKIFADHLLPMQVPGKIEI